MKIILTLLVIFTCFQSFQISRLFNKVKTLQECQSITTSTINIINSGTERRDKILDTLIQSIHTLQQHALNTQ